MNFSIAAKGHSFKGAFAYYLHDKGRETAERVAWAETRNLAHDDPAYAQSVMIATARQADAMKKAAGVAATGRKAGGPVHAYSISWHPENETVPDRTGMLAIAHETLKLLKADHLQAVIVAHQDTAHPHLHIVVNRVDPETGKMHPFGNDAHKLDEWAAKYERSRGQIVSPNRDEKHEDRKRKQEPTAPAPAKVAPAKHQESAAAKSRAAKLAERQAAQKERHKQEWADLSAANKARRAAINAERVDFKGIAAAHRAETRPLWSRLGKEQAAERRAFLDRETRISGIVRNAIDTVRSQKIRGLAEDQGFLAMCFNYTLSSQARHAAFDGRQQDAKQQLAGTLNASLITKFDTVKAERAAKLAEGHKVYDAARASLIERQNKEAAEIRAAWRELYADRYKAGPRPAWRRRSAANDSQARAPGPIIVAPTPTTRLIDSFRPSASPQEPQPVKPDFERASQLPVANQSPEPGRRVSVATPAPVPSPPPGVAAPSPRQAATVPKVDKAASWARSREGERALQQQAQKAAPDAARRAFRPAAASPAPATTTTPAQSQKPPVRDYWSKAADPPKQEQPKPARDYWSKEPPKEKPATPTRERGRDEPERDR